MCFPFSLSRHNVERRTGFEPVFSAWKAEVINQTRPTTHFKNMEHCTGFEPVSLAWQASIIDQTRPTVHFEICFSIVNLLYHRKQQLSTFFIQKILQFSKDLYMEHLKLTLKLQLLLLGLKLF